MFKCYVCNNPEVVKVFTNSRGTKHYYCKSCAKKYLVKCRKDELHEKEGGK